MKHTVPFQHQIQAPCHLGVMLSPVRAQAYTFSVYSDLLKTRFGYTQTQLAGVGTAGNIGGCAPTARAATHWQVLLFQPADTALCTRYLAIFSGLFFDRVKQWDRYCCLPAELACLLHALPQCTTYHAHCAGLGPCSRCWWGSGCKLGATLASTLQQSGPTLRHTQSCCCWRQWHAMHRPGSRGQRW